MAVDPDGVVKGFDVLEHKSVSVSAVFNPEAVEPFALDERVKGWSGILKVESTNTQKSGIIKKTRKEKA